MESRQSNHTNCTQCMWECTILTSLFPFFFSQISSYSVRDWERFEGMKRGDGKQQQRQRNSNGSTQPQGNGMRVGGASILMIAISLTTPPDTLISRKLPLTCSHSGLAAHNFNSIDNFSLSQFGKACFCKHCCLPPSPWGYAAQYQLYSPYLMSPYSLQLFDFSFFLVGVFRRFFLFRAIMAWHFYNLMVS